MGFFTHLFHALNPHPAEGYFQLETPVCLQVGHLFNQIILVFALLFYFSTVPKSTRNAISVIHSAAFFTLAHDAGAEVYKRLI